MRSFSFKSYYSKSRMRAWFSSQQRVTHAIAIRRDRIFQKAPLPARHRAIMFSFDNLFENNIFSRVVPYKLNGPGEFSF